jgi:hypothetical protein
MKREQYGASDSQEGACDEALATCRAGLGYSRRGSSGTIWRLGPSS